MSDSDTTSGDELAPSDDAATIVGRVAARQSRQDNLIFLMLVGLIIAAAMSGAMVFLNYRQAGTLEQQADTIHDLTEFVGKLNDFENQASCAFQVHSRFLLVAGTALSFDHSTPDGAPAVRDAVVRATTDLGRLTSGEEPCNIAIYPS